MYIVKYNAFNADGVFIKIEYKDLKMSLLSVLLCQIHRNHK